MIPLMSAKLEKLARKLNIDPASLPPIDGKSVTVNIASAQPQTTAQNAPVVQTVSLQAERQRLERELQQARQRLNEFQVREREQRRAERARLN
jgi:hypothetical protein